MSICHTIIGFHIYNQRYILEARAVNTKDIEAFKTKCKLFNDEAIVEVSAPSHIDLFLHD